MATNGVNNVEDAEMADYDGEKVVTMMDVLQEEQDFEDDANAVLGASDEKNCTYSKGYIKRQAIYACLTCCSEAKDDPTKRAGVCLACSLNCHENHELIELYTKRNFRCDCGNPKFNSNPCQFTPDKSELNVDNNYNQNFSGLYCNCHRPYPDPESTVEDDEMIQCIICEDWLHSSHLDAVVPGIEQYSEMVCKACMENNVFLHDYNSLAVNVETRDVDVINVNGADIKLCNGDLEVEKLIKSTDKSSENTCEPPKNDMDMDEEPVDYKTITESGDTAANGENIENLESDKSLKENKEDESNEFAAEEEKKQDPPQATESSDINTDSKGDENTDVTSEESTKATEDSEESTKINKVSPESQNEDKGSAEQEESKETLPQNEIEPPNTTTEINQKTNDTKEAQGSDVTDIPELEKPEENSEPTEAKDPMTSETSKDETAKTDLQSMDPEANPKESDENENDQSTTKNEPQTTSIEPEIESTTAPNDIQMDDAKPAENKDTKVANDDTNITESTETEKPSVKTEIYVSVSKLDTNEIPQNSDINSDEPSAISIEASSDTVNIEDSNDKKRKLSEEVTDENLVKKSKLNEETCTRPKGIKRVHKGATFWPSTLRQKLCMCSVCLSMYKDLSVLFLTDPEDTVMAYETLGKERVDGRTSQYEKGLEALSSLDRIQQINALTEYNKMKDKLLDFLKSFKDRKEIVKEEDIKAFFAGMKPKREPDGVYFCR